MLMKRTIFTMLFLMLGIFTVMSVDNDVGLQGEELSYNIVDMESVEMIGVIALEEATMQSDLEVSLIIYSSIAEDYVELTQLQEGRFANYGYEDLKDQINNANDRTNLRLTASAFPKDVIINSKGEVLTIYSPLSGTLS